MRVEEIMSTDVEIISPDATAEDARNRMHLRGIHHLIVEENNEIVGVVSDRDLGGPRRVADLKGKIVRDVMAQSVATIKPENSLRDAANLFRGRSIGCLPVVHNKKAIGIITVTDLLDLIGRGSKALPRGVEFVTQARQPGRGR